ncbi:TetR/AcrR family transcriptional regulator [Gordonia desulfuricans]|uniref:TetR/AcrR family transcriptional regulator n=1 Tax=Gordonia desulfuricans TaxID=89051 RepID=A0A7K3LUQ4_9ACTN|nr:TetR/AcrR family transcriptional regulator [Gordonia desulfuricans]NDK91816.1 TetR/AcrR family transcriptional regulator [Gordonia desulfuricans]
MGSDFDTTTFTDTDADLGPADSGRSDDDLSGADGNGTAAGGSRRRRKVRNTDSPADQNAAILAAAAAEFTEVGVRRANVDEVAKRAGVSRSTLYRRFPNKEALLLGVTTELYERGMERLVEAVAGLGPRDAVVEAFAAGAELVTEDPLMRRLVLTDYEMKSITKSVTSLFIDVVTGRVASTLRNAGAQMPDAELIEAVELHVRLVISFLETPASDEARQAPDAVRALAQKYLAPMIW